MMLYKTTRAGFSGRTLLLLTSLFMFLQTNAQKQTDIKPGEVWPDEDGNHIQAHGGGIIRIKDTYYWYGEERRKGLDTGLRYVSCYSSKDMMNWKFRGDVVKMADPENLGNRWVLERPKVYYNKGSKKYVMYFHLDDRSYKYARVGIAVSDKPDGNFTFVKSFRPLGHESRDIGQFIDDDGSAYLVFEDRPLGFHIAKLSADYMDVEREMCLIKAHMEGGAIVHYNGLYYSIGSSLTGWRANPNKYATAPSLEGPWTEFQDVAPPQVNTYGSQSTMLIKVVGKKSTTVIFMGDQWKPATQWDSRYLWMPLQIGDGKLLLPEPKPWTLNIKTGEWKETQIQSQSQGYLRADGKRIVNEKGENVLLRGIGLGGWMLQEGYMLRVNGRGQQQHAIRAALDTLIGPKRTQEFYDAWLANHTRKIDIDSLKSWGFNSVRLPIHYNLFTLPEEQEPVKGQDTWIEKGYKLTDDLLSWCKANHMYLILDLHAAPGGQGNDVNISDRDPSQPSLWQSEGNKQKTIALWRRLATRYAGEPWIGAYDIINEPNWGFSDLANDKNGTKEQKNEPLRKLMMDITQAIREVDKKHIIIIEGNGWGNNYNGVFPPWDNNMVLSYHKYWNKNDPASIKHILSARDQYNIPVWLGETGENSNVWFTEAIRLLESNNIGWSWWPLKKLGFNNPLQIKSNPAYEQIVNYWSGKGAKPDEATAYSGVMELAAAAKLENTIYHPDVVDAMIRQPFSAEARPYKENTIHDKTVLNAVDYDLGRNGVAYFDHDTADYHTDGQREGNRGHTYRNDGVDIRMDAASPDNYYVSDIETGEWMQYTINVAKKGTYTIRLTVSSDTAGGKLSVLSDGVSLVKEFAVPDATIKQWQTADIKGITLQAGKQSFRLYADKGGFNVKSFQYLLGD